MAQRYNQDENRGREGRSASGERYRGAASRWDEEDGGYGHSQYAGGQDYGRQQGDRYERQRGESWDRDRSSSRYGGSGRDEYDDRGQGWQSSERDYGTQRNYGASGGAGMGSDRGRDEDFSSGGYGQGRQTSERGYGAQRNYGTGMGSDRGRDEDLSTYGRQGSFAGGRGAYAGNDQRGQYGVSGSERWQETSGGGQGSGHRSASGEYDQPWRSGSGMGMGRGDQYGGRQQGFRGRGPKNYSRSDDRITEDINERLMDADDIDASEISVQVKDGVVTLEGSVEQRWMKHRIEDVAEGCSGVKDVENRIRVERNTGTGSERSTTTAGGTSRRTSTSSTAQTRSTGTTGATGSTTGTTGSGAEPGTTGTAAH